MCSEIISCLDDSPLTYVQADAMLAGITLDTKNFAVKTGVRTFEAAAYLRKRGANTLTVRVCSPITSKPTVKRLTLCARLMFTVAVQFRLRRAVTAI